MPDVIACCIQYRLGRRSHRQYTDMRDVIAFVNQSFAANYTDV